MWHALKGTGFQLDLDVSKMEEIEALLTEGLADYEFNPITLAADARVVNFPMPGGAIGPNVHMMAEAGILDRYGDVLAEFPVVVKAGGAWTSVTPGSQQYWLQAFNNVLHGRWKKIDPGYGRSVLGYFGKPPEAPDPDVVKIAAEQLKLEPFDGDPLEKAPDSLTPAKAALRERGLPVTEENVFLVASAIVPGKNMELNEGIRFLSGRARVNLPLKKEDAEPAAPVAAAPAAAAAPAPAAGAALNGPVTTTVTVEEGGPGPQVPRHRRAAGRRRRGPVGRAPACGRAGAAEPARVDPAVPYVEPALTPVYSPFSGTVELVDLKVKEGDAVTAGQVVAAVEAMKAEHDVRAPVAGRIARCTRAWATRSAPASRSCRSRADVAGWATLLQGSGFAGLTLGEPRHVRRRRRPDLPGGHQELRAAAPDSHRLRGDPRQPAPRRPRRLQHLRGRGRQADRLLQLIYNAGINTEFLPPLIFLGVGALTDFRPLLARPITLLLGAAAQLGIFVAALGAYYLFGFSLRRPPPSASSAARTARPRSSSRPAGAPPAGRRRGGGLQLHGPGAGHPAAHHAAHDHATRSARSPCPRRGRCRGRRSSSFPIVIAVLASLAIPSCAPLIGLLMFGNLLRVIRVTERLRKTAGGPLINIVTIFLGMIVGATMSGGRFLPGRPSSSSSSAPSAFAFSTAGGILFAKLLNLFLPAERQDQSLHRRGRRLAPCPCRRGWSRSSSPSRPDGRVNPLMAAMGPNVAGVIGSAVAAGVFLAILR